MNLTEICSLAEQYGCAVIKNAELKKYTSFKIGGICPLIIEINSTDSLSAILKYLNENNIRHMVLGKGSNVLCDDKGYNGVILHLGTDFSRIILNDNDSLTVEAGCSLLSLCRFALKNSLSGLEFAYGIPGSVGGAVYMNAGAYGGEMRDVVTSVECIDQNGNIHNFKADELNMSYRHSVFQENSCIITKVTLKLKYCNPLEIQRDMNDYINRRKSKQPLEYPSAGSTFKRPVGQFAGKLIQDSGLKGFRVGGAMISEKHSGFVINYDNATSDDVLKLINEVQRIVKEKTGYYLECEVETIPYE
ncbi:MAG: UDP-N-acetylmuramate dehydrogenase [Oscillospiraceae bacterium]